MNVVHPDQKQLSPTCLVSISRNLYSVRCEFAGRQVSTRLYPEQVLIVAENINQPWENPYEF